MPPPSLSNLRLAVNQKATGVTGDQTSPWARAGNTPGEMLGVGKRWADSVGQTASAWSNINAPANKGQPNERPATKAEVAARVLRAAQGTIGGIMGGLGLFKDALDVGFANLTAPIAAVFPSLPAATIMSPYLGTPHAHPTHPPSGPPPVPPTPCPSLGMTLLGVSPRVLINSMPAARCEDIGLAPTCMGLPPAWFRIKTGSSNVFIGGARAARLLDICKACKNIPDPPDIPAGKVMAAIGKAAGVASSAMAVAGVVAGGLGIAADVAEMAVEDDGAVAAGKALSAAMASVQMAADAAKMAVEKMMWKDPTLPPTGSMGAVIDPSHALVLIGGFPMINIPDPVGALLNRLKRYKAAAPASNGGCGEEGEPVDVVTGANLEACTDLPLRADLGLEWRRYYDSSRKGERGPLGWGWRHELQRELRFDLDGILYVPGTGPAVPFPQLGSDGASAARDGWTLYRVDALTYRLERVGAATQEFVIEADGDRGRVQRAFTLRREVRFNYDRLGRLIGIRGATHPSIQLEYDARGLLKQLTLPRDQQSRAAVLSYDYDRDDNLVEWTDALGHTATLDYDDHHRLTRKGDRRGYSYHYAYDAKGRCVHTWGEDGLYDVQLTYLEDVRCTHATHADGGVWAFFYDENGTITRIVDPYGKPRERLVSPLGRVVTEVDAAGNKYNILYDAAGGVIGRQDPFGYVNTDLADLRRRNRLALFPPSTPLAWEHGGFARPERIRPSKAIDAVYDALGRKSEERLGENVQRHWAHDGNGNILAFKDADGGTRRYEYVSWNLLQREIDPLGNVTEYAYTPRERVTRVVDPGGTTSEYTYDLRDNVVQIVRHGKVREEYLRDATDNLIEKRDGSGRTLLSFEIGPGNVMMLRRLASGESHRFQYDKCGRLSVAATDLHETRIAYGLDGRPTSDIRNGRGVRYGFAGTRRTRLVVLERYAVAYTRGVDGTLTITDPTGANHSFSTRPDGTILLEASNGTTETRRYDPSGRCVAKTRVRRGTRQTWRREYAYSAEGDLLSVLDSYSGRTTYEYDASHRLVGQVQPDGGKVQFAYDAAGNLLTQKGLSGVVLDTGNRLAAANGETFTYNDRDHIASRANGHGLTHFEYDSCDRLIRCVTPAGEWQSTYDPFGRRITKTWQGATTEYYWDDNRLAAERGPDGRLRIYLHVDAAALVPFMFVDYESEAADIKSGRRYFISTDQIGTPIHVENDLGETVWQSAVDAYGVTHVRPGNRIDLTMRFPGHQDDGEVGLFYNRFRHYSPMLGRYLQSDPLGIPGTTNLYAYPANPLTTVDIFGLTHPPKTEEEDGPKKPGADEETTPPRALEPSERDIAGGKNKPFDDLPPLQGKTPEEVRDILAQAGFSKTQNERTVDVPNKDGGTTTRTDGQGGSEIWMRQNADGSYENVRIDPHGHNPPPNVSPFAGDPPHAHLEFIPDDQARRDGATFPPRRDDPPGTPPRPVLPPGSSNADAADAYNNGYTPGVFDPFNDNHNQTKPTDFDQNHIPLKPGGS